MHAERHPELVVLARFEEIGTYVKYGDVAQAPLFENLAALITGASERLTGAVRLTRAARPHERVWTSAELLADQASAWRARTQRTWGGSVVPPSLSLPS